MGIPKRDRETSSRWEGPCVLRPARLPRQPASSGTCCGRHNRGAALPGVPGVPGAPGLRPCAPRLARPLLIWREGVPLGLGDGIPPSKETKPKSSWNTQDQGR